MRSIFENKARVFIIIATIIIATFMGVSLANPNHVDFAQNTTGTAVSTVQGTVVHSGNGVSNFFKGFSDTKKLADQNELMLNQIHQLQNSLRQLEDFKVENERLRSLLEFKQTQTDFSMVGAQVIAKDTGNWFTVFTIDKGTADGISASMPVVTDKGIVGYVQQVGLNWSKVVTIIDSSMSVAAYVTRTADLTTVDGDLSLQQDGLCKMRYISKGSQVAVGDQVATSGFGGIYPKGILIGTVQEIRPDTLGLTQYAIIKPAENFEILSKVLVIKNNKAQGK